MSISLTRAILLCDRFNCRHINDFFKTFPFQGQEGTCSRCLRNSPLASLIGFIIVLIGAGAFGGATIFARRYLIAALNEPELLPCLDYVIYGLIGALGLFSLLAYFLCAVSSGSNAKQCFESRRKAACGRCCNTTLLISLVIAILLWSAILCLLAYGVISIGLLLHRDTGPERILSTHLALSQPTRHRVIRQSDPMKQYVQVDVEGVEPPIVPETATFLEKNIVDTNTGAELKTEVKDAAEKATQTLGQAARDVVLDTLSKAESYFFKCDEGTVDLSYYGLYDSSGLPIRLARKDVEQASKDILICVCVATAGIFLILFGYVQITICAAMNYARLKEKRYFEISDAADEGNQ